MRNITPEELKKLWEEMQKTIDDDLAKSLVQGAWGQSTVTTHASASGLSFNPQQFYGNISPTDIDAKGRYSYQEPEQDEQGTYYGYKVLHKCTSSGCRNLGGLVSPRYQQHWDENGELHADKVPAERHMHGIHFTKRPDHPELHQYYGRFHGAAYSSSWYENSQADSVLVKCALSGTIVETEQGFRAEHAQIVGVFINGNWQSYQDYQERTRSYTRSNPFEEKEWKRTYWQANWDSGSITNPDADS